MKIHKYIYIILAIVLLASSCRKEIDEKMETEITPDPAIQIEASVIGLVQDENLNPVEGAVVKFQGEWIFTDENGIFQMEEMLMPENGAYIQVEKEDYFIGSRVFYPRLGNENQVVVQLIEKQEVGSFQSAQNTTIEFEGVELDFQSDGIVDENNQNYQGEVHVVAKYLDPTLDATHVQMPGDLTAYDEEGDLVSLTSFAMIGVELLDDNGGALQLAEGKSCTVHIPIPVSLQNTAPNSIPLWYFDEEIGRWIEDGEANLVNGEYVGEVKHFTFWNCDIPSDYTTLHVEVTNGKSGLVGVRVRVTDILLNSFREDITNIEGYVGGIVPAGTPLLIEVINACGEVAYSEEIESLNAETYKTFVLPNVSSSTITGSVSTCASSISENAYVRLDINGEEIFVGLNDDYSFETTIENCGSSTNLKAAAYDPMSGLVSQSIEKPFSEEMIFEELTICDTILIEHVYYSFSDSTLFIPITGSTQGIYISYATKNFEYGTNGERIKANIEVVSLNWLTGTLYEATFVYDYLDPYNEVSISVDSLGFTATGTGDSYIAENGSEEFFVFTGTLTDLEITTEAVYNPAYDPFTYRVVVSTQE